MNPRKNSFWRSEIAWIVLAGVLLVAVQVAATLVTARQIEETSARIAKELSQLDTKPLESEKTRQEVLNLRIQNEIRGFLSNSLLINLGPIVTAFVALVGALLGLRSFLQSREKDRLQTEQAADKERAERERARLDRAYADFKDAMDRLVKQETWQRVAGVLGLQHFLSPQFNDYHLRAASALSMASRMESDNEAVATLRIAIEQSFNGLDEKVLQQASWQGCKLLKLRLHQRALRQLDLRDAYCNDTDFGRADLSRTSFRSAHLNGAKLDGCKLVGADLCYADLAGASLVGADLTGALLSDAKVLGMDINGADLRTAIFDAEALPWELITNWRRAQLDPALRARLIERFGAEPSGPKILMLMWELPPFVAGGTWTACYHLVRNLRRAGADVTVVVPWSERLVAASPFGSEVRVVCLGITPPELADASSGSSVYSVYGTSPSWSAYSTSRAPSWSPYGATAGTGPPWSPYAGATSSARSWSPYSWLQPHSGVRSYNSYGASTSVYGSPARGPSVLLRLIDECRRRFVRFAFAEQFDVIHAHDWVTFPAAAAVAKTKSAPWIAHFHSIEADRRPDQPDWAIQKIEREGAQAASAVLVPSKVSAQSLFAAYQIPIDRIEIAPNTLSREAISPAEYGLPDMRRVLFLGRLTSQKGPDLFAKIAVELRARMFDVTFDVRGSGEQVDELQRAGIWPNGEVEWSVRGRAFGESSALLVTSRAEPFGMVILEAMQRRVPVFYPRYAGAAEVLQSGIKIDPTDTLAVATALADMLNRRDRWEEVVMQQSHEIAAYLERGYERVVQTIYQRLTQAPSETRAASS